VRAFHDSELLAAILEHLRHEREPIKTPVLVQCGKDFSSAAHLHAVSGSQKRAGRSVRSNSNRADVTPRVARGKPSRTVAEIVVSSGACVGVHFHGFNLS
jgi:hypothetical protein